MSRMLNLGALCAAAALVAAPAQAAVIASLTFTTPNGTALSNESIQVFATLTLDAGSDAITTDGSGLVTSGISEADIVNLGIDPMTVTGTNTSNYYGCSGTFTLPSCAPAEYAFDFNFTPPSFAFGQNIDVQAGESATFLFGTFNPVGGNAAPGLYTFYDVGFFFEVSYMNPDYDPQVMGSPETLTRSIDIANTCSGSNAACAFTREVLAAPGGPVPEPATWAMMILGFGAAGSVLRRRRAALVS